MIGPWVCCSTTKVVVITGAGNGIGRSHALAFAAEGASVVVNDAGLPRDGSAEAKVDAADAVVKEIDRAAGGRAVASHESVADYLKGAGHHRARHRALLAKVDVLVNNAGILRDKTFLKMDEEMWDAVIAVHLKGTFLAWRSRRTP